MVAESRAPIVVRYSPSVQRRISSARFFAIRLICLKGCDQTLGKSRSFFIAARLRELPRVLSGGNRFGEVSGFGLSRRER